MLLRIQLDIELALIPVIIRQQHKNPLPLFFYRNIDPMVCITVCPLCYGKSVCSVCVKLHMMLPHLPAQIFIQLFRVNFRRHFNVLLLHRIRQFNRLLIQHLFKRIADLE